MNLRKCFIIFLALLLVIAAFQFLRPTEPTYNGRKLSQWLSDLEYSSVYPSIVANDAAIAVRHIGSNAVPALVKMVRAKDFVFKLKLMELVAKQSFFKISFTSADDQHAQAHAGFLVLGSAARSAIPALSETVESEGEEIAIVALRCLLAIGPESLPTFIKALTNSNTRVEDYAAFALGEFGSAAKPAIPTLLLKINSMNQNNSAIRTLGEIGDDTLIPLFSQLLLNTNTAADAGFALSRRGPEAIAPLTSALTNSAGLIRAAATAGLDAYVRETGPGRKRMDNEYSFARINCLYNLKMLGASSRMYAVSSRNPRSLTNTPPSTSLEEFSP